MQSCEHIRPRLLDLVEDPSRDPEAERGLWSHLEECVECSAHLDQLRVAWRALPDGGLVRPRRSVREAVLAQARTAAVPHTPSAQPIPVARRRTWLGVAIAALIVLSSAVVTGVPRVLSRDPAPDTPSALTVARRSDVVPGQAMPSFAAMDIGSGELVSLEDLHGQIVLLNIWATWCPPCESEMSSMERLYRSLGSQGLAVVAVSVDQESTYKVRTWIDERGLTFTVLHDREGAFDRAVRTAGVPETFVIDRDGVVVSREVGPRQWDAPEFEAFFDRLLREGA